MPSAPFSFLPAPALALALVFGSSTAQAGPVEGRYMVTVAGLQIGQAQISAMISQQSYRATLNAQLSGLAGALTSGRAAVQVSGAFAGSRSVSNGYALTATNSKINRTIQIGMGGGSNPILTGCPCSSITAAM
jgi:hypothetical protein